MRKSPSSARRTPGDAHISLLTAHSVSSLKVPSIYPEKSLMQSVAEMADEIWATMPPSVTTADPEVR
jgi:hypothetical protein